MQSMDFLDPKKKRAHIIRLYVGYALMAIVLAFGTMLLVFSAYGYDIDRQTGNIIQNGLMIVDARPSRARIFVNGQDKGNTDDRLVLPAGRYNLELRSDGYNSWNHEVNLEGSSIEQLGYPFLFPSELVTKSIHMLTEQPDLVSASPDQHWLITHIPSTPTVFNVIDLESTKNPIVLFNLPANILTLTGGPHSFEAIEWSEDNVNILLKHSFAGGAEFIVLNREDPSKSLNLNKLFASQPFTSVTLRDKKPDQFYLLNSADGSLFQAEVKNKQPVLVLNKVLSFKSYEDDTLLYIKESLSSPGSVEARVHQSKNDYLLRTMPAAPSYLLDIARFDGVFYVATGSLADHRTYLYKNPFDEFKRRPATTPQPFRVFTVPGSQFVSFSANARFFAVQGNSNFSVYDAETGRQYRYDMKLPLEPKQKAIWMDGHRLVLTSAGKINIFDFDGTNKQTLSNSQPAYGPFFNRDYDALYSVSKDDVDASKTIILRTELRVPPVE